MLDYDFDMSGVELEVALPDLVSEGYELDALISAQADWSRDTPAVGWTIAHQIAHLASPDENGAGAGSRRTTSPRHRPRLLPPRHPTTCAPMARSAGKRSTTTTR